MDFQSSRVTSLLGILLNYIYCRLLLDLLNYLEPYYKIGSRRGNKIFAISCNGEVAYTYADPSSTLACQGAL